MFKLNCPQDHLIHVLKEYGYCLIRLPRIGIQPLEILEKNRDGTYALVGNISKLFIPHQDYPVPSIPGDKPAPDQLVGKESTKLKKKLGLELLSTFTQALGLGEASTKISNTKVDKISFELNRVKVQEIDFFDLDRYLNRAELDPALKTYQQKLKDGELYVISATLKSKSFSIKTYDKDEKAIQAIVQDGQEILSIESNVEKDKAQQHQMTYEGQNELVFGFKAARILFQNNTYRTVEAERGTLKGVEKVPVQLLEAEEHFLGIVEKK